MQPSKKKVQAKYAAVTNDKCNAAGERFSAACYRAWLSASFGHTLQHWQQRRHS